MKRSKELPDQAVRWKLLRKLQNQVNKLHGADSDGDKYARVEVHDRREGQWPYICPVPHIPFDPTPEQLMEAFDAATNNVRSAYGLLDYVRNAARSFFQKSTRETMIKEIAKRVFGKDTVIVGCAYSMSDDRPQWHTWRPYRAMPKDGMSAKHETVYYPDNEAHNLKKFRQWLIDGRRSLLKEFKHVKSWYIRLDGAVGITLSGLYETPESVRPYHIARNRARHNFLAEHADEIEANAKEIEAKLRSGSAL